MKIQELMALVDEYAERRHGRGFVSDVSVTYPSLRQKEREARVAVEKAVGAMVENAIAEKRARWRAEVVAFADAMEHKLQQTPLEEVCCNDGLCGKR